MVNYLISLIFVFFSIGVVYSLNPIYNILFFILVILNSVVLLLVWLNSELLGFSLLIVYVGAIAVLFLFIIMMLNLKAFPKASLLHIPAHFLVGCFFFSELLSFLKSSFSSVLVSNCINNLFYIDSFTNIEIIGQVFFSNFLSLFLITGFVLLASMLVVIILTLNNNFFFDNEERTYIQLARSRIVQFFG